MPTDPEAIGWLARDGMPVMRQAFVGERLQGIDQDAFERKLYVIRRRFENLAMERSGFVLPDEPVEPHARLHRHAVWARRSCSSSRTCAIRRWCRRSPSSTRATRTNTFGAWDLAQPFRYMAHNGEINTLKGNRAWMRARQGTLRSDLWGDDLEKIYPVMRPSTASDSAQFDNALEFLCLSGRELPEAILMMIPEAWENHEQMDPDLRAYYEYHSFLLEPWDGPASIAFTDGRKIGAVLDRNGLRPSRYVVTKDGLLAMASEVGVVDIEPERVLRKGRLQPGRIFFVDLEEGRIVEDEEIKAALRVATTLPRLGGGQAAQALATCRPSRVPAEFGQSRDRASRSSSPSDTPSRT